jgi:methylated-DNA-[protein]-cysteine S-methyltransferase
MKKQNFTPASISYLKMKSPLGDLYLLEKNQKLAAIYFEHDWKNYFKTQSDIEESKEKVLVETKKQLDEYFKGKRKKFEIPMQLEGTPFQIQAWKTLLKIPFGKTVSYKEQAQMAGKTKAIRAIGSANGCNQIPIIIPCHRVVASDGGLGGYSGGLKIKEYLLALEK